MSGSGKRGGAGGRGSCRGASLCAPEDPLDLLAAGRLDAFRALLADGGADADRRYGEPHFASLLEMACQRRDVWPFAAALLDAGADPRRGNDMREGKTAAHFAADAANADALAALLRDARVDVNAVDARGATVLHALCRLEHSDDVQRCLELVLAQPGVQLDVTNRQGQTPIWTAARHKREETVRRLLEASAKVDIDKVYDAKTARVLITENFKGVFDSTLQSVARASRETTLMDFLYTKDEEGFVDHLKSNRDRMDANAHDGLNTLLQKAVLAGMERAVKELLENDAKPDRVTDSESRLPTQLAALSGRPAILKHLLDHKASVTTPDGKTALHYAIQKADPNAADFPDYEACFDVLLQHGVGINAADEMGNTPLHMAAKFGHEKFTLSLLKRGAYIGTKNKFGMTAVDAIAPATLNTFLNECVSSEKSPRDVNYKVIFDVQFLKPPDGETRTDDSGSTKIPMEDAPTTRSGPPECECEPLLHISRIKDLRPVLNHPVVTSFLEIKWRGVRQLFWTNLIFYVLFVALLTVYILFCYESATMAVANVETDVDGPVVAMSLAAPLPSTTTPTSNDTDAIVEPSHKREFCTVLWAVVAILFIMLALRELFQLVVDVKHYFWDPENYLELALLIACGSVVFYDAGDKIKPHLSAITILLSWAELVLLIGKHPRLSTNIEMFKTVSKNFLNFLAWYSILIVAFALSFFSLFRGSSDDGGKFFLDPGSSFFKTVVMVTGEFEAGDMFDSFVMFPGTSHVVLLLFVFLVAIVLFNLLNGLAVSDTHAIREDAELVAIVSRIRLISYTEKVLLSPPFWCSSCDQSECCMFQAFTSLRKLSLSRLTTHVEKVRLFPNVLPEGKITVLPNQEGEINLESGGSGACDQRSECYSPLLCQYYLEPSILKAAEKILEERRESAGVARSASQGVHPCAHLEKIDALERNLLQLQQSSQRNQETLQRILQLLENSYNARLVADGSRFE